jgi:dTDP-4-dehydrorhamnose 3,5-epimerase
MIFKETKLKGAYIIELEPIEDERGFFARSFCQKEFGLHGINLNIAQCNISFNKKKGTLRGMHYQAAPHEEAKIVSCIGGSIYDVIVDLRPDSSTYCKWIAIELSAASREQEVVNSEQEAVSSESSAHRSPLTAYSLSRSSLTAHYKMLYIPKGFAHGFLTLEDNTEVFYHMSEFYAPGCGRGVRWNDPAFGIDWPAEVNVISDQDRTYPEFKP